MWRSLSGGTWRRKGLPQLRHGPERVSVREGGLRVDPARATGPESGPSATSHRSPWGKPSRPSQEQDPLQVCTPRTLLATSGGWSIICPASNPTPAPARLTCSFSGPSAASMPCPERPKPLLTPSVLLCRPSLSLRLPQGSLIAYRFSVNVVNVF